MSKMSPLIKEETQDYDVFEPVPEYEPKPGEPVFVLRAQDILAAPMVKAWCEMATVLGVDPEKIKRARKVALAMERWPHAKIPD